MSICGTYLSQTLRYSNIVSIVSNTLCTQYPDCNLLIQMDEYKMLFISWWDSYAWLSRTWFVFHTAVTTAGRHYPLPHCVYICCLASLNAQQVLIHVSEFQFFFMEESWYTLPCQISFFQTAPLLFSMPQQQNVKEYWWEGSTSTITPPASSSDIIK